MALPGGRNVSNSANQKIKYLHIVFPRLPWRASKGSLVFCDEIKKNEWLVGGRGNFGLSLKKNCTLKKREENLGLNCFRST